MIALEQVGVEALMQVKAALSMFSWSTPVDRRVRNGRRPESPGPRRDCAGLAERVRRALYEPARKPGLDASDECSRIPAFGAAAAFFCSFSMIVRGASET